MATNDRQLSAYLKAMPDAPHLKPLAKCVGEYAMSLKLELQSRTSTGGRANPVSEASMIDLLLRIERVYTKVERKHGTNHGGQ